MRPVVIQTPAIRIYRGFMYINWSPQIDIVRWQTVIIYKLIMYIKKRIIGYLNCLLLHIDMIYKLTNKKYLITTLKNKKNMIILFPSFFTAINLMIDCIKILWLIDWLIASFFNVLMRHLMTLRHCCPLIIFYKIWKF